MLNLDTKYEIERRKIYLKHLKRYNEYLSKRFGLEYPPKAHLSSKQRTGMLQIEKFKVGDIVNIDVNDANGRLITEAIVLGIQKGKEDGERLHFAFNSKPIRHGYSCSSFIIPTGYSYQYYITEEELNTGKATISLKTNATPAKTSIMSIISKARMLFKLEPEKTFIKAGIMDQNGNLTDDGKTLFIEFLLNKYGPEFKTEVADKIVAEDENRA